jgi:hypothetical protein
MYYSRFWNTGCPAFALAGMTTPGLMRPDYLKFPQNR